VADLGSYASEVKKELTTLEVHREHARAELEALIRMNGSLSIANHQFVLNVQTENPAIARRIYALLRDNYSIEAELLVRRKMKLKKNNLYIVRLKHGSTLVLNDLHILTGASTLSTLPSTEVKESDQKMRSYLRWAFLAGGSVNNPETSRYHLEIYSLYEEHNLQIAAMINQFGMNARVTERRGGYIVYLKEGEKIADFLQLIGATSAMLKFEDIRIVRDMRNSVNRLVNCETANLNKTIDAATHQVENIKFIEQVAGLDSLPQKLQEIAILRLANPDITLKELGERVPSGAISKSGINHRLRKLMQIADNLRAGKVTS
jgi:DNA-binding protein WhiA